MKPQVTAAAVLLTLALSGCTQFEMATHFFKKATYSRTCSGGPGEGGVYKTGSPYTIDGVRYHPLSSSEGYRETGIASWYGEDFHQRLTANGECYDMYQPSAAHPTLPLPSWVRVTHMDTGRSIVVRVNDRGPYKPGRIIDLSYAAANQLGVVADGVAPVRVEALPEDGPRPPNGTAINSTKPPRSAKGEVQVASTNPVLTAPRDVEEEMVEDLLPPENTTPSFTNRVATAKMEPVSTTFDVWQDIRARQAVAQPVATAATPVFRHVGIFVQTGAFGRAANAERQLGSVSKLFANTQLTGTVANGSLMTRVRVGPFQTVPEADAALQTLLKNGYMESIIVVEKGNR